MSTFIKPAIACFSGNDPTGGAGIQADIESLNHFTCHALPFITSNTLQDSQGIQESIATETAFLKKQFNLIKQDISLSAIKVGLLIHTEQIDLLSEILAKEDLPCVLDTIFSSGLGSAQASEEFIKIFCDKLLSKAALITPNYLEAQKIARALDLHSETQPETLALSIAQNIQSNVLITGTHFDENSEQVFHFLALANSNEVIQYKNPRLKGSFHGSGCTLASSLAALLAQEKTIEEACQQALTYTFETLRNAQSLAKHQLFPSR